MARASGTRETAEWQLERRRPEKRFYEARRQVEWRGPLAHVRDSRQVERRHVAHMQMRQRCLNGLAVTRGSRRRQSKTAIKRS
eukprot:365889-Chlamydomonas_euryale.AAC.3